MRTWTSQLGAGLRLLLVMTVLLGVVYPLAVWTVSRLPGLRANAEGSVLTVDGTAVGSDLVGVNLDGDRWFQGRPSVTAPDDNALGPGDPSVSGASNKAGDSTDLAATVRGRRALIAAREGVDPATVPPDAVTASASGLDPHISTAYALLQVPRVARANGLSEDAVRRLVAENTDDPPLGDPVVNVLLVNVALARL